MNDEKTAPEAEGFQAQRVRTLADMRRATDSRMIAGVCSGAARYLNVDPVVLRILLVVLTFAGLAGPILYLAAWFFIPEEGAERSIAAEWFNLNENETQVRSAGLIIAAVVAIAAVVGDSAWDTEWIIWPVLVTALCYWLFVVRPRRKRADLTKVYAETGEKPAEMLIDEYKARKVAEEIAKHEARPPRSPALMGLTLSAAVIGVAITWIVDLSGTNVEWTAYVAVALSVVAVGTLVGTFLGDAGVLMVVGTALVLTLGVGSLPLAGGIGQKVYEPETIVGVKSTYELGAGELIVDLTNLDNPEDLAGRTIRVRGSFGHTAVRLPDNIAVRVDAHLGAGQLRVLDKSADGRNLDLVTEVGDGKPLKLIVDQKVGNVEVDR